jgi:hypothetical protein
MNALDIQRRLFLASAVGALALRPSRTAQADTNFTNYSFAATGAPTARTMPDRLADITNVKDFGAVGNGRHEDASAINAAIQYRIENGGGIVFFPTGSYKVNRPIIVGHDTLSSGVRLNGTGKNQGTAFVISGSYSDPLGIGYLVSKGNKVNDCLEMISGFWGLWVKATRDNVVIEDLRVFVGQNGVAINVRDADCAMVRNCAVSGGNRTLANDIVPAGGLCHGTTPGSIGINLGRGVVTACRGGLGAEICIAMSGVGSVAISNSFENVGEGVRVGWNAGVEEASYGAIVMGTQIERGSVLINLYNATAAYVCGNMGSGSAGPPDRQVVTAGSWSGGTATMTVGSNHNLPVGVSRLQLLFEAVNANWAPEINQGFSTTSGLCAATRVNATQFSYPLTNNPGSYTNDGASGWTWPWTYSFRCRKVYDSVITGSAPSTQPAFATIDLDYDGAADHNNNVIEGVQFFFGWKMPTNRANLASWKFINCRGGGGVPVFQDQPVVPFGTMVFADLPGQSGVKQDGPFEGQEYDITDGAKSGGGAAVWNDTVQGGGSGHYKVRYNGSVWKRIG